jgi:hypothetical protein
MTTAAAYAALSWARCSSRAEAAVIRRQPADTLALINQQADAAVTGGMQANCSVRPLSHVAISVRAWP